MYNKSSYDHIFYRMKKTIPRNKILFYLITILKVYPLFLLSHSAGYMDRKFYSIHSYYKYFTLSYYFGTMASGTVLDITIAMFIINLILIIFCIIYLSMSKKVQEIDQNYSDVSSLGIIFFIFSNIAYFKYIILFQFFNEINFMPMICFGNVSHESIKINSIFSDKYKDTLDGLCSKENKILFCTFSLLNILIDIFANWTISSRFFDLNILSDYYWNFPPKYILSFEFLESFSQCFFSVFLWFDHKVFLMSFSIYVGSIFLLNIFEAFKTNYFCSHLNYNLIVIRDFVAHLSYFATIIILLFMAIKDENPNDLSLVILLILEIVISIIIHKIQHKDDSDLVKQLIVEPVSNLNESNIYKVLTFSLRVFVKFNDVNEKFDDESLDIFLYSYIDHLKSCDDSHCPCKKNLKKKVEHNTNTATKTGFGHTSLLLSLGMKKDPDEDYILNTFFNVLSSNLNTSMVKLTKGTNVNLEGKDSERQKTIYQLRVKLIEVVKKLFSHKFENLIKYINTNNSFSESTKDFIRLNFYSFSILCNNAFYKTQFYYYEYINEMLRKKRMMDELSSAINKTDKKYGLGYSYFYIYYLYLRMFAIKKYKAFMTMNKMITNKGKQNMKLDFTKILSLCVKYYEIEDRLMENISNFQDFIQYFIQDKIKFDDLINIIKLFMSNFNGMKDYIIHYFKNDKINNLFICSKIILFFKVINFQIPDDIFGKLTSQIHDLKDTKSGNELNSKYYMIINYINGDFIIKFLSHELLLTLGYEEDDLKNKDFHILMPQKIQRNHKHKIISDIKSKNKTENTKQVFINTSSGHCILFELQYKYLLNLRGEITILAIFLPVDTSKETQNCFICIDDTGEIIALNREFENYFFLNMHIINNIKLDTEKYILQGKAQRMKHFFKDNSNIEFKEQFNYETYLNNIFGEEFDSLKENNDKDYNKNYAKYEYFKSINQKGHYMANYIEIKIRQRILDKQILYFINYSIKINLNRVGNYLLLGANSILIDSINNAMKEMVRVTILKNDIMMNTFSNQDENNNEIENQINDDEKDELIRRGSINTESSLELIAEDTEINKKSLFNSKSNKKFNLFSKNHFIVQLIISISILILFSIILTGVGFNFKINLGQTLKDYFYLEINSILLEDYIFFICEAIIDLGLIKDNITYKYNIYNNRSNLAIESIELLKNQIDLFDSATYNINFYTSKYYSKDISKYFEYLSNGIEEIFVNGHIYIDENDTLFDEITKLKKKALDSYHFFLQYKDDLKEKKINKSYIRNITYDYFLLDNISYNETQNLINNNLLSLELNGQEIILFYVLQNTIPDFVLYNDYLINEFYDILKKKQSSTLIIMGIYKFAELFILVIMIILEWIFIYLGFKKFKNKIFNLRLKIEKNHIDIILQKIEEYKKFSNGLNIESIYYISDMDINKLPEIENYYEDLFPPSLFDKTPTPTGDSNFYSMLKFENSGLSNQNSLLSPERGSERKKNIIKMMQKLDKLKTGENSPSNKEKDNTLNESESPKHSKFTIEKKEEEKNGIEHNEDKIKSVLKKSHENKEEKDKEEKEDDSKINILKKDEGLGLSLKKKKKPGGVQFKEVSENNNIDGDEINNIKYTNKFQNLISNSNLDINTNTNNNFTPGDQDTIRALNQKEINKKINSHIRINLGNKYKNELPKEEIEKKIVNMIHSNLNAKILLNIGLLIFMGIFIASFVIYCLLDANLEKARNFTFYYFQKSSIMNEIILNYQLHLIKNIHDEQIALSGNIKKEIQLESLLRNYKVNSDKIIDFTNENNINSILKETSSLITIMSGKSFCENFATFYIRYFPNKNLNEAYLKEECLSIGEKMNINGYTDAESYSYTTISVYIEDWKNIYNFNYQMNKENIKEKLNEEKFINVIEEMVFTSSKFSDVLTLCLFNDFDAIFDKIKTYEIIFGLICIIFEILFFTASILVIIYPIRSVDIVINWFSKRYGN